MNRNTWLYGSFSSATGYLDNGPNGPDPVFVDRPQVTGGGTCLRLADIG